MRKIKILILAAGRHACTVNLRSGWLVVMLLCIAVPNSQLLAKDAVDAAKEAFENLARAGKFLQICPQYEGMNTSSCAQAAQAGDGLGCPFTRKAVGGDPEKCHLSIMSELKASVSVDVKAKLEASKLDTAEMYVEIEPKESVVHTHSSTHETPGVCGPYIARIDFVRFRFALFRSSGVKLSITTPSFPAFKAQAEGEDSEGSAFAFDSRMCGRIAHEGECGPSKTSGAVIVPPEPNGKTIERPQPPKTPAPPTSGTGEAQPPNKPPTPPPAPPTNRSQTALAGNAQIFVAGEVSSEEETIVTVRGPHTLEGMVVSVEAEGKKTEARTDSKGHAVLNLAALAGGAAAVTVAAVRVTDPGGQQLAQAQTRITPGGPTVAAPPQVPNLPTLLRNGDVVTIPGRNLGSQCQLVVGNRSQETLAASSKELTSFVDAPAIGPQPAYVLNPNGASPSQTVHCYNFSVKAPQNTIVRGQHIVAVANYEGLPSGSEIEFTNASPTVVKMKVQGASHSQGEKSVFTVSQPAGSCEVELVGKGKGAFMINYKVRSPQETHDPPPQ